MSVPRPKTPDPSCKTLVLCLASCVLCLFCSCAVADEITVFFTGNELGQLKPCGCSGGQLGGLERRWAVINAVDSKNRMVFDTGSLVPDSSEQDLIKFQVVVQAFASIGYDVVNLTERDILIARQAGLLDGLGQLFNCITAAGVEDINLPARFTKRFSLNDKTIDVTIATADTDDQLSQVDKLFSRPEVMTVNILITNKLDADTISAVANTGLVDCILVEPDGDEPKLMSNPGANPIVISQPRLGKYAGKLQVELQNHSPKPRLSFSSVTVTEDFPQHQPLVELYREYQKMLKDARLLENYPRFVLPDNLKYVGSKSCKLCHDYEYKKWLTSPPVILPAPLTAEHAETAEKKQKLNSANSPAPASSKQGAVSAVNLAIAKNRHSSAFATLEDVNSDYDPECVICHVVGMRYETGFVTPDKTPELKDVGCETCHGPGSEHVTSRGAVETTGPKMTCTDCHTTDHSVDFAANEKQYKEREAHRRPPAPKASRKSGYKVNKK